VIGCAIAIAIPLINTSLQQGEFHVNQHRNRFSGLVTTEKPLKRF
jgi:hypothetical protein